MLKNYKSIIIIFLMLFFYGVCGVYATDFMVSPAKIEISITPGENVSRNLLIANRLGYKADFKVEVEDIEGTESGQEPSRLLGDKTGRYSLKNYFNIPITRFSLENGESFVLPVGIKITEGIEPGGLYGAVLISTDNGSGDAPISAVGRIGALFFVRVFGESAEQGVLEKFVLEGDKKIYRESSISFSIFFRNKGNVHLNPYGFLQVQNIITRKIEKIEVDPYFCLPGSLRERQVEWQGKDSWGIFKARLFLNRGYGDLIDESSVYFAVLPLHPLAIIAGALILLVAIVLLLIKKRKK